MIRWALLASVFITALVLHGQSAGVLEQAAERLKQGRPDAAIALLDPAVKQDPRDFRALTLLGMALSAAGKREEAGERLLQALAVNANFAPALRGLAMNEMALGRADAARKHFEALLAVAPGDTVAHLALGEIHFAAGQYAKSVSHYDSSGGLYLQDSRNLLNYAKAAESVNESAKAAAALEKLPAASDSAAHLEAGLLLARLGSYDAAAGEFERARGHSDAYAVGFNLALALFKGKRYREAAGAAEALLARGFRKAELQNLLAHAYENSGRTKDAYEALRVATELEPGDETNYIDLTALCLSHKNLELALEIASIGLRRLPKSDRLYVQRGVVRAMKGQFPEAQADFEEAARLAPNRSLPHVALGLALVQTDRIPEAVEVLRKRTKTGKDDYLALWFLAEALNRAGVASDSDEGKEAATALARSLELKPDLVQPRVLLAKMLLRRGELNEAAEHLERVLRAEPDNVAATYQLAQVYSRKGDKARAGELFAKVSKAKAEDREQFTSRGIEQIVREGAR